MAELSVDEKSSGDAKDSEIVNGGVGIDMEEVRGRVVSCIVSEVEDITLEVALMPATSEVRRPPEAVDDIL